MVTPQAISKDGYGIYSQNINSQNIIDNLDKNLQLKIDDNTFNLGNCNFVTSQITYTSEDGVQDITEIITQEIGFISSNTIYEFFAETKENLINLSLHIPFNLTIKLENGNSIPLILDRNSIAANYLKTAFIEMGLSETDATAQADEMSLLLSYNCSNIGEIYAKIVCATTEFPNGQSVFGENYNTLNFVRIDPNIPAYCGMVSLNEDEDSHEIYFSFALFSDADTAYTGYDDGTYSTLLGPDMSRINENKIFLYNIDESAESAFNKIENQNYNFIKTDNTSAFYSIVTLNPTTYALISDETYDNYEIFYNNTLTEYVKLPINSLPTNDTISDDDTSVPTAAAVYNALQNVSQNNNIIYTDYLEKNNNEVRVTIGDSYNEIVNRKIYDNSLLPTITSDQTVNYYKANVNIDGLTEHSPLYINYNNEEQELWTSNHPSIVTTENYSEVSYPTSQNINPALSTYKITKDENTNIYIIQGTSDTSYELSNGSIWHIQNIDNQNIELIVDSNVPNTEDFFYSGMSEGKLTKETAAAAIAAGETDPNYNTAVETKQFVDMFLGALSFSNLTNHDKIARYLIPMLMGGSIDEGMETINWEDEKTDSTKPAGIFVITPNFNIGDTGTLMMGVFDTEFPSTTQAGLQSITTRSNYLYTNLSDDDITNWLGQTAFPKDNTEESSFILEYNPINSNVNIISDIDFSNNNIEIYYKETIGKHRTLPDTAFNTQNFIEIKDGIIRTTLGDQYSVDTILTTGISFTPNTTFEWDENISQPPIGLYNTFEYSLSSIENPEVKAIIDSQSSNLSWQDYTPGASTIGGESALNKAIYYNVSPEAVVAWETDYFAKKALAEGDTANKNNYIPAVLARLDDSNVGFYITYNNGTWKIVFAQDTNDTETHLFDLSLKQYGTIKLPSGYIETTDNIDTTAVIPTAAAVKRAIDNITIETVNDASDIVTGSTSIPTAGAVADALATAGSVQTVNGETPDESGNINISFDGAYYFGFQDYDAPVLISNNSSSTSVYINSPTQGYTTATKGAILYQRERSQAHGVYYYKYNSYIFDGTAWRQINYGYYPAGMYASEAGISSSSTHQQFPTSKAVYDYVSTYAGSSGSTNSLNFLGTSTTTVSNGGTETPTIDGGIVAPSTGDIVLYNGLEFIFDGSVWQQFGDESTYVPKTRTINGKALISNITLSASDITNALSSTNLDETIIDTTNNIDNSNSTNPVTTKAVYDYIQYFIDEVIGGEY